MKSNIKNLLILLVLVRFVASFAVWQKNELQFDSFVFAQQWNIAECVDINVSIFFAICQINTTNILFLAKTLAVGLILSQHQKM